MKSVELKRQRGGPFRSKKTAASIAREQGIKPIKKLEDVLGKGKDLWDSDQDLDKFLSEVRQRRQEGLRAWRK